MKVISNYSNEKKPNEYFSKEMIYRKFKSEWIKIQTAETYAVKNVR